MNWKECYDLYYHAIRNYEPASHLLENAIQISVYTSMLPGELENRLEQISQVVTCNKHRNKFQKYIASIFDVGENQPHYHNVIVKSPLMKSYNGNLCEAEWRRMSNE